MTRATMLRLSDDLDRILMLTSLHLDLEFASGAGGDCHIRLNETPRPTEVEQTNRNGANELRALRHIDLPTSSLAEGVARLAPCRNTDILGRRMLRMVQMVPRTQTSVRLYRDPAATAFASADE